MIKDSPDSAPLVHFIGIGGIGMSALAQWFLAQKWAVSGSDSVRSVITEYLRKSGVKVKIGHKKTNVGAKTALVVYSTSIVPQNPERKEARRRGIPELTYPQALGELTRRYDTIAIAGSHGKSTTTALTALILVKAGLDPTVVIGTKLREFGNRNFRYGKSKFLVVEADEWKAAFHNYSPRVAVITNVDKEHLDYYKNYANVQRAFLGFARALKPGSVLIVNGDDPGLRALRSPLRKITRGKSQTILWYNTRSRDAMHIKKSIRLPGVHNLSNAVAAYTVATKVFDVKKSVARAAIVAYRGAWRRMEFRGYSHLSPHTYHLPVYDDYAHHPTEIKATLRAFREKFPKNKIICVYQPHQAKRLKALFEEFQGAFKDADITLIAPVYEVEGRDSKRSKWNSETLVRTMQNAHPRQRVFYLSNLRNVKKALHALMASPLSPHNLPPVLIMMGAGDVVNYTSLLLE